MDTLSLSPSGADSRQRTTVRRTAAIMLIPLACAVLAGCAIAESVAVPMLPAAAPTPAPLPNPSKLSVRLKAVSAAKITALSTTVLAPNGQMLVGRAATKPLTPASTMKVMTTMAGVEILGANTTFSTRVVDAGSNRLVLVGGGDPLLTDKASTSSYRPASLQQLAARTVAALKGSGRTRIALSYDASLFSGPTFSPSWKKTWVKSEARVAALEINSGMLTSAKADPNPPRTAALALAARLRKAGITVVSVTPFAAPATSAEVARVTSAPLALIVKRTLLVSDNVAAETISRHAARARGAAPSFSGAAANVKNWMSSHALWTSGQKIYDGSGLSPANRLTTASLSQAITIALADGRYQSVISGLPIAGQTGTLASRFDDKSEKAGRGRVHAKTGTLRGVAGLAGYVTTADGARLPFAELANTTKPVSVGVLYNWLDRSASVTASCGCR